MGGNFLDMLLVVASVIAAAFMLAGSHRVKVGGAILGVIAISIIVVLVSI